MTDAISEEKIPDPLQEARELLKQGLYEQCLSKLKPHWLSHPDDVETVRLFAELMEESGRSELSTKLSRLADLQNSEQDDNQKGEDEENSVPYAYFEAGFGLIDVRQHELAVMLLERCLSHMPDEPTVNYEIAFSLMSLGKFEKAVQHFERAATDDGDDFDTTLNLCVCYTLTRRMPQAKQMLERLGPMAKDEDERREVAHRKLVLKRLETLGTKKTLNSRDWLYVLYGGILLLPEDDHPIKEDNKSIASTLLILKGLLEGLRVEFEAVEYYNTHARPIARILAEIMNVPVDSYKGPERPDRALTVLAWATDIIGPHQAFVEHLETRSLFSYGLTWNEPLPVACEITGCLVDESIMPWDESSKPSAIDSYVEKIVDRARSLECDPEILRLTQDAVNYYDSKRELIVLNNWEVFPDRPEYTAEVLRQQN